MSNLEYKFSYRRHLPHIQPPGATLFVTFRLANSIPTRVLKELLAEVKRTEAILSRISDGKERARQADMAERRMFGKWDRALDVSQEGPFWLREPRIATLVAESLHRRDKQVYDLEAYCIMPNHVHLVCAPMEKNDGTYHSLAAIMHSLKLYTARQANLILDREGNLWQHENYDHFVRDEKEWHRIVNYVLNNPVAAGLVRNREDWKWSYCKYADFT